MKSFKLLALTALMAATSLPSLAQAKTDLTVYTAFETDLLSKYKSAFEQDNPDIDIHWVRDSTGVITSRLLAEGKNSPADVVWGLAASSLQLLKDRGLMATSTPANADEITDAYKDQSKNPAWYGNDGMFAAVCFNKALAKKNNIPEPHSWQDLTKPVYKGLISMPNPASSGTGYMQVSAWLQSMGEDKGWAYMDALDKNVLQYQHSGSKPCAQAATGEVVVGISLAVRGAILKTQGAPLDVIVLDNAGWDLEAVGITSSSKHKAASERLLEWSLSKKANEMYNENYPIVGNKTVNTKGKASTNNYPDVSGKKLDNDFSVMASERDGILKKWGSRYSQ
ncbi:iron(III) transport system substrate-binding protein [Sinobacterium caligoides]|uniref:Iron(III) transport system substrate-binding protein n=1 Tax=Sinobacterium caligoides TaxID=933926 RepID=A0A3N2E1H7_9GAMM|nr:putative 2-aminoethylphosphonate ABC transporter substrate-binding protein [Sinobacterium caligoides]ROS05425.1 iron(III) transport system substrate-binding protein [Sinobacterium caligoides]